MRLGLDYDKPTPDLKCYLGMLLTCQKKLK